MKYLFIRFAGIVICFFAATETFSQTVKKTTSENPDRQEDFEKTRKTDFTKLIGGIQEGAKVSYSAEKTILEGSGGGEIKSAHLFLQGTGNVGTTTNLSDLFSQKTLPTFSVGLTAHFLIPGLSTWFYDGSFTANKAQLAIAGADVNNISTITNAATQKEIFKYRPGFQEAVEKGEFKENRLYTFKRMFWLSLSSKYDNSKYSFYDQSKPFNDQFTNPLYQSLTGKLTVNSYFFWNKTDISWTSGIGNWRPNFIYITASLQYGKGNNISQLKKKTVNDISSSYNNSDNTINRQVVKSQTGYTGTFYEYQALVPSFELMLSPVKAFALDIFGEHNLINGADRTKYNLKNYGSIATGIYFFGAGKSSSINIGAYYQWTKNNVTGDKIEQIGIKTTIPITPL